MLDERCPHRLVDTDTTDHPERHPAGVAGRGLHAVDGRMHTRDLHATLLALMGLDHTQLRYRFQGRNFRLTDVGGRIVKEIMA